MSRPDPEAAVKRVNLKAGDTRGCLYIGPQGGTCRRTATIGAAGTFVCKRHYMSYLESVRHLIDEILAALGAE